MMTARTLPRLPRRLRVERRGLLPLGAPVQGPPRQPGRLPRVPASIVRMMNARTLPRLPRRRHEPRAGHLPLGVPALVPPRLPERQPRVPAGIVRMSAPAVPSASTEAAARRATRPTAARRSGTGTSPASGTATSGSVPPVQCLDYVPLRLGRHFTPTFPTQSAALRSSVCAYRPTLDHWLALGRQSVVAGAARPCGGTLRVVAASDSRHESLARGSQAPAPTTQLRFGL